MKYLTTGNLIQRTLTVLLLAVCATALAATSGCGSSSAGAEATGIVTLDGQPLPNVLVSFYPTGDGSSAFASTDESGHFMVQTTADITGLAPGEYRVAVEPNDSYDMENGPKVPAIYKSDTNSGIVITVEPGGDNMVEVSLTSDVE